jgi:hypothetical protein
VREVHVTLGERLRVRSVQALVRFLAFLRPPSRRPADDFS